MSCTACAENNKQGMGGLQWFDNMKLPDWGSFADEYSDSSCYYHLCGQMPSSPRSRLTDATFASEDDLTELENVLLPMKEDLVNSCIPYAKHIEALANSCIPYAKHIEALATFRSYCNGQNGTERKFR